MEKWNSLKICRRKQKYRENHLIFFFLGTQRVLRWLTISKFYFIIIIMIISIVITIIVIIVIIIVNFAVVKKSNLFFDKERRNLSFVSIKSLYKAALVSAPLLFEHTQTFNSQLYYINLPFLNSYIPAPHLLIDHPSWPGGSKHSPR